MRFSEWLSAKAARRPKLRATGWWADGNFASPRLATLGSARQDTYVYIIGELKEFNNKRHVSIKNIRRIKDFNEVSYHLLESLSVSLQMRGGGVSPRARGSSGKVF